MCQSRFKAFVAGFGFGLRPQISESGLIQEKMGGFGFGLLLSVGFESRFKKIEMDSDLRCPDSHITVL